MNDKIAEELPYGGTVRDVRLQIARLAAEAEGVFVETLKISTPWTDEQRKTNLLAHGCSLHGWAAASLLRWIGEEFGEQAAFTAAAMVQDMAMNGGAYCDDISEADLAPSVSAS